MLRSGARGSHRPISTKNDACRLFALTLDIHKSNVLEPQDLVLAGFGSFWQLLEAFGSLEVLWLLRASTIPPCTLARPKPSNWDYVEPEGSSKSLADAHSCLCTRNLQFLCKLELLISGGFLRYILEQRHNYMNPCPVRR